MVDFISQRNGIGLSYFDLIGMIDGNPIDPSPQAFDELPSRKGRHFWIRHDVDNHIERAWEMAKAEAEAGLRAIYFFLNTAAYFRWDDFIRMARDFAAAGHAIGLHNNSVTAASLAGDLKRAEGILQRDLDYLRRAGDVWITASHGDSWNRRMNVLNYEMFSECRRPGRGSPMERKPLAHYGLKYEAYFAPHNVYLSDSGGKWTGSRVGKRDTWMSPAPAVEFFNSSDTAIMQILVHPEWWTKKQPLNKGEEG